MGLVLCFVPAGFQSRYFVEAIANTDTNHKGGEGIGLYPLIIDIGWGADIFIEVESGTEADVN